MAQATAIVIEDGQATPADVTFNPESITPSLSTFVDRTLGIFSRFRRLSIRFAPASAKSRSTKTSLKFSIPVWGTLPSGAQGILYTLRSSVELELPDGCTASERNDIYAFTVNGLQNPLIRGNMRDMDPLY